jgi:hypothetical protein
LKLEAEKRKIKRKRKIWTYASNSIGRVAVSKTACWGFESLLACFLKDEGKIMKDETKRDLISLSSLILHPSTFLCS